MSHLPHAVAGACFAFAALALPARPAPEPASSPQSVLEPFELVLQAELVVEGVIADFDPEAGHGPGDPGHPGDRGPTLDLEVGEVLFGFAPTGPDATLAVLQLAPPALAQRYAGYERGQRALFFLRRSPRSGGELRPVWTLLGAADEGEWPLVRHPVPAREGGGEFVLFRGAGIGGLEPRSSRAFGHHYFGYRSSLDEVRAMISGLRRCYEWTPVPEWRRAALGAFDSPWTAFVPAGLRRTCSEAELSELCAVNALARAVLESSQARAAGEAANPSGS